MSAATLTILALAAPIIAMVSGIWGLTKETSVKTETGDKQLTPAGRVMVALAGVSAMVAVASLGFKALVDQGAEAEVRLEGRQKKYEKERARLDELNWRDFNRNQQDALSQIGIDATKSEGIRVVSNQELLAAIAEQRDRSIAGNARIFQIAQSQRIILEGQPLGSLQIKMVFGGFNKDEFKILENGLSRVLAYPDSDDEYYRLASTKRYFDNANLYGNIFVPMLGMLMVDSTLPTQTNSLILSMDLDGTGAWVFPIGVTDQTPSRGLVFNSSWLYAVGNPNDVPEDDIQQDVGACVVPRLSLDKKLKQVSITVNLEGNCLPFAIHRAGTAGLTAKLSSRPAAVIYRNGEKIFPIKAANVANITDWVVENCWNRGNSRNAQKFIRVVAVPNKKQELAIDQTLRFAGTGDMTFLPTYYDSPEDWDAGLCAKFR